ncbi:MAG: methyltransferase domain-containing protein [Campylobacterales bacterium]|nr:methyltransferase domain-containing protein [Campylobacterales bacterium]
MLALGKKIYTVYKDQGVKNLMFVIFKRIYQKKARSFPLIKGIITNKYGIEIGGPSPVFNDNSFLPIYSYINHLDNCNFSSNTLWNKSLREGYSYNYHQKKQEGYQFIQDGINLASIKSDSYDFLLSSHVLEHIANPIKALHEWKRIIKTNGYLILLVPHKDGTFDHQRPTTTLDHLIQDYQNDIGEDDLTHLEEILQLHDFSKDSGSGSYENFKLRSENNLHNRALHHHVFNTLLLAKLIDYAQMQIQVIETIKPMHILLVVQKISTDLLPQNNIHFTSFESPFPSDQG